MKFCCSAFLFLGLLCVSLMMVEQSSAAWIERKMLSSFRASQQLLNTGSSSLRQERYAPLIMTTDAEDVDLIAVNNVHQSTILMNNGQPQRHKRQISLGKGKKAGIISRTLQIAEDWKITVYEWEKPAAVVETYWQVEQQGLSLTTSSSSNHNHPNSKHNNANPLLDPFGLVCWPGSVVAAQEMKEYRQQLIAGKRVLLLGAGVGVEAQAAAMLGAKHVIATDIHPTTLKLLEYGAEQAGLSSIIKTQVLDLNSIEPLPECDTLIVADVLYNERLALLVMKRILESQLQNSVPPAVLVSDSQRFVTDFDVLLSAKLQENGLPDKVEWVSRWLPTFTGSGVLVDSDQTYDVKARVLWLNK